MLLALADLLAWGAQRTVRSLISILTDLAEFIERCQDQTADDVGEHFDDLAAADWVPIMLEQHAQALTEALSSAIAPNDAQAHSPLPAELSYSPET